MNLAIPPSPLQKGWYEFLEEFLNQRPHRLLRLIRSTLSAVP